MRARRQDPLVALLRDLARWMLVLAVLMVCLAVGVAFVDPDNKVLMFLSAGAMMLIGAFATTLKYVAWLAVKAALGEGDPGPDP
jgi:hypothetical protein